MKLYVLDNGKIVMSANNNVTLEGAESDEIPAIPIHSFLLDTPAGYVVFDCACDPEGMSGSWPQWMTLNPYIAGENGSVTDQLALAGVRPEEVSYVVMSHLHVDHVGCLPAFTNAKVYVGQKELVEVLKGYAEGTLGTPGNFHLRSDVENCLKAGIRWCPLDEDIRELKICDGVTVLNLGSGHSFGMLALAVELECGNYLLAADNIYSRDHFGPPAQMAGVCCDEEGYYKIIEVLRSYAQEHHCEVLFGHDMAPYKTLKKVPEFYE